jgi:hypothetical protein
MKKLLLALTLLTATVSSFASMSKQELFRYNELESGRSIIESIGGATETRKEFAIEMLESCMRQYNAKQAKSCNGDLQWAFDNGVTVAEAKDIINPVEEATPDFQDLLEND